MLGRTADDGARDSAKRVVEKLFRNVTLWSLVCKELLASRLLRLSNSNRNREQIPIRTGRKR